MVPTAKAPPQSSSKCQGQGHAHARPSRLCGTEMPGPNLSFIDGKTALQGGQGTCPRIVPELISGGRVQSPV